MVRSVEELFAIGGQAVRTCPLKWRPDHPKSLGARFHC